MGMLFSGVADVMTLSCHLEASLRASSDFPSVSMVLSVAAMFALSVLTMRVRAVLHWIVKSDVYDSASIGGKGDVPLAAYSSVEVACFVLRNSLAKEQLHPGATGNR
jgi:hypothetical protein